MRSAALLGSPLLFFVAFTALGCSASPGGDPPPTRAGAPSPSELPASTPSARPTLPPQPTPAHPAPPELVGEWVAEVAEDDVIRLELTEKAFDITRFGTANGRIEVFDDEIVFSHSSLCVGDGRYTWTVSGDTLSFESVTPDECPDRAKSIDGIEFTQAPD